MNSKQENRLTQLEVASTSSPQQQLPEIPAGFTGTLIVGVGASIWLPDNGRGPADHPKPNIVRVG